MRTTFSRLFLTTLSLLLVGLLLVGASFRLLVENYMEESAVEGLRSDAQVISGLASVYISDDSLGTMEFLMNLDVASQVSGADAVICNSAGRGMFSTGGHYVVALGILGGKVCIADPGLYTGKYSTAARKAKVQVSGDLIFADAETLNADCIGRAPRYYLFSKA